MLKAETMALLEPGCSLVIGLASPDGEPLATRGWGITLLPGDAVFRLILDGEIADVPWFEVGVQIAVTGGDVATLRAVQIKGQVTRVEPTTPDDRTSADRHADLFFDAVAAADGTDKALLTRLLPDGYIACEATIVDAYKQTPGPGAGAALEGEGT